MLRDSPLSRASDTGRRLLSPDPEGLHQRQITGHVSRRGFLVYLNSKDVVASPNERSGEPNTRLAAIRQSCTSTRSLGSVGQPHSVTPMASEDEDNVREAESTTSPLAEGAAGAVGDSRL